jgi:hypothetical protein
MKNRSILTALKGKKSLLLLLFCFLVSVSLSAIDFNFGIAKEVNWSVTITYQIGYDDYGYIGDTEDGIPVVGMIRAKTSTTEIEVSAKTSTEAEKKAVEIWNKQKRNNYSLISANAIRLGT